MTNPNATYRVLREVLAERGRQDAKFGEQNHRDSRGDHVDYDLAAQMANSERQLNEDPEHITWTSVLLEEVWEACAERDPAKLRAELVQVAAVATAWIEAIDRRTTNTTKEN
jgi:hypothetical protein